MSTHPKYTYATEEAVQVDPAVQAILDQLHAPSTDPASTSADPSVLLAAPPVLPLFRAPAGLVAATPPAGMFTTADQNNALFGRPDTDAVTFAPDTGPMFAQPRTTPVFADPSQAGGRRSRDGRRVYLAPAPPSRPGGREGWFLPVCQYLECFEDDCYVQVLWSIGDTFDFDEAAEMLGWQCTQYRSDDPACPTPTDEDYCDAHRLTATPWGDLIETMAPCEHWYFEAQQDWADAVPLMRRMRQRVLDRVAELAQIPAHLDWIFHLAGYQQQDIPDDPARAIIDTVRAGATDTGPGAAFADEMLRHYSPALGADGIELAERFELIKARSVVQQYPEQVIIFDRLHPQPAPGEPAELSGRYRIHRTEYHSALPQYDDQSMVTGYLGTCLHFVTPVDQDDNPLLD